MKVLVTTIVSLNPGDAAILLGTIQILREALGGDVEVVAIDKDAATAARLYPWVRFVPSLFRSRRRTWLGRWIEKLGYGHRLQRLDALRYRWAAQCINRGRFSVAKLLTSSADRAVIREYLGADVVLASGGTYLVPAYNLETPLLEYEFVLAIGRRFGVLPQSMGPFTDRRFTGRMRSVLARAMFVLLRDERSMMHVRELGVPMCNVRVVPDAAFALCTSGPEASGRQPLPGRSPRVAISVRYWPYGDTDASGKTQALYLAAIAGLVARLVEDEGAQITFVSSCQGVPEYWVDDSRIAAEVVGQLTEPVRAAVTVDSSFRDPQSLLAELRMFDLVVATRMHVAILALCAGVAVLPIAYEFKTSALFARLGLEHLVVDFHEVTVEGLVSRATMLLHDTGSLGDEIAAGRNQMAKEVRHIVQIVRRGVGAEVRDG